jgi:TolA-binding protein
MSRRIQFLGSIAVAAVAVTAALLAQQPAPISDEELARRQLESGRTFARQGKFNEALRDFKVVAENYPTSSVADDALSEIAHYYLDKVGDYKEAEAAVTQILKKYPNSNSAPDAHNMAGRLALARSHQTADVDAALANFDRVPRLFQGTDAVPRALVLAGQALWYAKRYDDAIVELSRVEAEYPTDPAAASAYLASGRVRVPLGDPIAAMEELQQVRDRFPNSVEAPLALAHATLLHRLYVRAKSGPAFALSTETLGPPKLENVVGLAMTAKKTIYFATEQAVGVATSGSTDKPPAGTKVRGLTLDNAGALVVIDTGVMQQQNGKSLTLPVTKSNGQTDVMLKVNTAVQLSNGNWLVMDDAEKSIFRFSSTGAFINIFAPVKITKMAVNDVDEVAAIDKDQKAIALFDAAGKSIGKIPLKGTSYDIQDAEDLAYDDFGHLYVLDRSGIAVFSPYSTGPAPAPAAGAAKPSGKNVVENPYHLLTFFTEPDKAPGAFRKATAFVVDPSGSVYLYDENAKRIMVYR